MYIYIYCVYIYIYNVKLYIYIRMLSQNMINPPTILVTKTFLDTELLISADENRRSQVNYTTAPAQMTPLGTAVAVLAPVEVERI